MPQNEIAISVVVIILVALIMGFHSPAGVMSWFAAAGHTRTIHPGFDLDGSDCRIVRQIGGRCKRLFLSVNLPAIYQPAICADQPDAIGRSRICRKSAGNLDRGDHPRSAFKPACRQ